LAILGCVSCQADVVEVAEQEGDQGGDPMAYEAAPRLNARPAPRHRPGPDLNPGASANRPSQVAEGAYPARSGPIPDEVMAMENIDADLRMLEDDFRRERESAAAATETQAPVSDSPYADEAHR
jgi:hypothetical protein